MDGFCIRVQIRIFFSLSLFCSSACVVTINQCAAERKIEKSGEGDEIYVVVVVVVRGERLKLNDS